MSAEVIDWADHKDEPVAGCECGSTQFHIRLNGYGKNWDAIIGTECCECGDKIDWKSKDAEETLAERRDADDTK